MGDKDEFGPVDINELEMDTIADAPSWCPSCKTLRTALAEEKKAREEEKKRSEALQKQLIRTEHTLQQYAKYANRKAMYRDIRLIGGDSEKGEEAEEGLTAAYLKGREEGKDLYKARVAQLEEAIQRALDDEESGEGWGPDVTVCGYLRKALTSSPSAAAEVQNWKQVAEDLREEMKAIAVAIGRSKTDGESDCDWYDISGDIKAAAEVLRAAEELSSSVTVWDYGFIEFPKSAVNKVIEAFRKYKEDK